MDNDGGGSPRTPPSASQQDTYSVILVTFVLMTWWNEVHVQSQQSFNLIGAGAVGDGNIDDSQAFIKAWEAVCEARSPSITFYVPSGKTFLVKPLEIHGPCNSPKIIIKVLGKIVAPKSQSDYPKPTPNTWLQILNVNGLTVDGDGSIDGRGQVWWNTCQGNVCPPILRPSTISFTNCNNLNLGGLTFVNSGRNHISITSCNNVVISRLNIQAPAHSPNTDGINIALSTFVAISQCYIATDTSIGSLGKGGSNEFVQNVHVWNCTFKDTQNGARIKTWQGGLGYARNIIYEDIKFKNASNPIIIDQFYCPQQHCTNQTNAVKISDVAFRRFSGTSQSVKAIVLHCSQSIGCTIQIEGANIISTIPGQQTMADCFNAHVVNGGQSFNVPSLKNCL